MNTEKDITPEEPSTPSVDDLQEQLTKALSEIEVLQSKVSTLTSDNETLTEKLNQSRDTASILLKKFAISADTLTEPTESIEETILKHYK